MQATIAICTWNRASLLREALIYLCRMRVPPNTRWEVLVVDNNSYDDTPRCLASFEHLLPLRVVDEPRPGVAHARNRAICEARGTHVLFTDDDVLVEEDWLASYLDASRRHPEAAAIGGRIEPLFPHPPDPLLAHAFPMLASGFCGLDHGLAEGPLPPHLPLFTANLGFRLDALHGLRFDTALGPSPSARLVGEDTAMVDALRSRGETVVWCPTMRVRHLVDPARLDLPYLVSHHVGYSESMVRLRGAPPSSSRLWLYPRSVVNLGLYALLRFTPLRKIALQRLRAACHWWGTARGCHRLSHPKAPEIESATAYPTGARSSRR